MGITLDDTASGAGMRCAKAAAHTQIASARRAHGILKYINAARHRHTTAAAQYQPRMRQRQPPPPMLQRVKERFVATIPEKPKREF